MVLSPETSTNNTASTDEKKKNDGVKVTLDEKHRYRLYLSMSCPYAHRVRLVRLLYDGLDEIFDVTWLKGQSNDEGFVFGGWNDLEQAHDVEQEPEFGVTSLKEVYQKCKPHHKGRYTVPLIVDRTTKEYVMNESLDAAIALIKAAEEQQRRQASSSSTTPKRERMQDNVDDDANSVTPGKRAKSCDDGDDEITGPIEKQSHTATTMTDGGSETSTPTTTTSTTRTTMLPKGAEILAKDISDNVTSAVYKYMFASTDPGKRKVVTNQLWLEFDKYEELLTKQNYILGDTITFPDLVFWPSLIRYDNVYARQFGIKGKSIKEDYPNLKKYIERIWNIQTVAARATTNTDPSTKTTTSQTTTLGGDANLNEIIRTYWQSTISRAAGSDPKSPPPKSIPIF